MNEGRVVKLFVAFAAICIASLFGYLLLKHFYTIIPDTLNLSSWNPVVLWIIPLIPILIFVAVCTRALLNIGSKPQPRVPQVPRFRWPG